MDSYRKSFSAMDDLRLTLAALYIVGLPLVFLGLMAFFIASLL